MNFSNFLVISIFSSLINSISNVSRDNVEKSIKRTRAVSAAGVSGWRPYWYKQLLRFNISSPLTIIINYTLSNHSCPLRSLLRPCRLISFSKNSSSIRPINILEALMRVISRAIELSLSIPTSRTQYAIRNPNGISQIPWFLRLLLLDKFRFLNE
jgi:hypothetical protein